LQTISTRICWCRYTRGGGMKTYKVIGGYTVYEQYEINVEAKDDKEAIAKAEKIPVEKWDELQNSNDGGFIIDDVWEEDENN